MAGVKKYLLKNGDVAKSKDIDAKRRIVAHLATVGDSTLADISKELEVSVPTITKLVAELNDDGIVADLGKVETAGGRRPNIFGLHKDANVNFLGIAVEGGYARMVIIDLQNNVVARDRTEYSPTAIAQFTDNYRDTIIAAGICASSSVDIDLDIPVHTDTSTRAMCYAECMLTDAVAARNMLYVDLSHTPSVGIVANGQLYYGHSGLAGALGEEIALPDNADTDDEQTIDLIEKAAEQTGRAIASLLRLLNPELVVIGGTLARAGDYLMLPLQAAIHKHTPKTLYRDTRFRLTTLDEDAAPTGAAMMIRNEILGLR